MQKSKPAYPLISERQSHIDAYFGPEKE